MCLSRGLSMENVPLLVVRLFKRNRCMLYQAVCCTRHLVMWDFFQHPHLIIVLGKGVMGCG